MVGVLRGVASDITSAIANATYARLDGTNQPFTGEIEVPSIQFDVTKTGATAEGQAQWNSEEDTLDIGANGVTYQLGQELSPLYKNQTGSTITNGTPCMFAGAVGASGRIKIQPAIADGSIPAEYITGIATQDILDAADGHVTWFGKVRGIDTTGTPYGETWADGDLLYVSPTTAGYLTKTKPQAPNYAILVAAVVHAHAVNGVLQIRPHWADKLVDLSDVNGTPLTSTGQFPVWDNSNGYFDFNYNINDYAPLSALSSYVPYTGATSDVVLGAYKLTANKLLTTTNLVEVGFNNTIGSGTNRIAVGIDNVVSGNTAYAVGKSNSLAGGFGIGSGNTTSTSSAVGHLGLNNQGAGLTVGFNNNSGTDNNSFAIGGINTLSNTFASAIGKQNTVSGFFGTAMGYLCTASGSVSFASGFNAQATNSNAFSLGMTTVASGSDSVAIGKNVTASATASGIIGMGASAVTNSTASSLMIAYNTTNLLMTSTRISSNVPVKLKQYTVATLPAGQQGDTAYVTDATAPTYLGALVGGGAIVCPVFHNGTAWVSA